MLGFLVALTACRSKDPTQLAEQDVERFHQRWNQDDFTGIFNDAHMRFRSVHPANVTIGAFQHSKTVFGALKSSKKRSAQTTDDNGEPVIVLKYDSAYEHGAGVERFGYRMSGTAPLLADYELRLPQSAAREELLEKAKQAHGAAPR